VEAAELLTIVQTEQRGDPAEVLEQADHLVLWLVQQDKEIQAEYLQEIQIPVQVVVEPMDQEETHLREVKELEVRA
jgi:hypothetical protein